MKSLLLPALLLVSVAHIIAGPPPVLGSREHFPAPTPIKDADPSVRITQTIQVPTQLAVRRTTDRLSVSISGDEKSFEDAKIEVGSKMVTGMQCDLYVYPEGTARPGQFMRREMGDGTDFKAMARGASIFNTRQGGIPEKDKTYVVEMVISIFETDIPGQHEWSPESSKKYKVIWTGTLKSVVRP